MNRYLKSHLLKLAFVTVLIAGILSSCKKNSDTQAPADCGGTAKTFAADVRPIVQASCSFDSDCHGSGSASGPGSLLNYSQIFNARSAIRAAISSGEMPKNGSLTSAEKNAIICWIDNGAVNN